MDNITDDYVDLPHTMENMYLIHSYIYYCLDTNIITDSFYDDICRCLYDNFDKIQTKWPELFEKDALAAGTGHHLMWKFPEEIKKQAEREIYYVKEKDGALVNWRAWFEKESANLRARKANRRKKSSKQTAASI